MILTYTTTRHTTASRRNAETAKNEPAPAHTFEIIGDGPVVHVDGCMPRSLANSLQAMCREYFSLMARK